jgi:DNA-binding response OmpR family regulator
MEEEEDIMEALQAGAADFLIRPFKPSELAIRIIHILEQ